MDVYLHSPHLAPEHGRELDKLADLLNGEGIDVEKAASGAAEGTKDPIGFTTGLAIAGLSLTSLGTLTSALSYWQATRPQYSMNIRSGNREFTVTASSLDALSQLADQLEAKCERVEVVVSQVDGGS